MSIFIELKQKRLQWNLSIRELADILKVDNSKISRWENQEEYPTTKNLLKWADSLGCNIKLEFRK